MKESATAVVEATIDVYNTISLNLLPTPSKSHYLFNLRDISKVFQGVSQGSSTTIKDKLGLVRIWSHECLRVFGDRLINNEDRDWFAGLLQEKTGQYFEEMSYTDEVLERDQATGDLRPLLFGNYMEPGAVVPVYQHVSDFAKLDQNMVCPTAPPPSIPSPGPTLTRLTLG